MGMLINFLSLLFDCIYNMLKMFVVEFVYDKIVVEFEGFLLEFVV